MRLPRFQLQTLMVAVGAVGIALWLAGVVAGASYAILDLAFTALAMAIMLFALLLVFVVPTAIVVLIIEIVVRLAQAQQRRTRGAFRDPDHAHAASPVHDASAE